MSEADRHNVGRGLGFGVWAEQGSGRISSNHGRIKGRRRAKEGRVCAREIAGLRKKTGGGRRRANIKSEHGSFTLLLAELCLQAVMVESAARQDLFFSGRRWRFAWCQGHMQDRVLMVENVTCTAFSFFFAWGHVKLWIPRLLT